MEGGGGGVLAADSGDLLMAGRRWRRRPAGQPRAVRTDIRGGHGPQRSRARGGAGWTVSGAGRLGAEHWQPGAGVAQQAVLVAVRLVDDVPLVEIRLVVGPDLLGPVVDIIVGLFVAVQRVC